MTSIETIKELLARATKGSWDNTIYCKRDGSPIKTIADIEETVSGSASYSDRLELFGVTLDDKDEDGLATVICYTGNGPNAHNNAALIAAAPELARRLIDAEARIAEIREILKWEHTDAFDLRNDIQAALTQPTDGEKL